jgi:hypothetical protein
MILASRIDRLGLTKLIAVFTRSQSGAVPPPGTHSGTTFLADDQTWKVPGGTGLSPTLTHNHVFVGNSSNVATDVAMSGDVAVADTGATTIQPHVVTLAKIANAAASSKLVGSGASGSGATYSEITLGTGLSMSGTTLNVSTYGPLFPTSIYPVDTTGRLFPQFAPIVTVFGKVRGMAVKASLDADAIWRISFQLPPFIPAGTCKLVLRGNAPATSGVAKVTPSWAKVGDGVDISGVSLSAETQQSYTWSVSNSNLTNKVALTSPPAVGDENKMILMDLTFNTTSWTLAQISVWTAFLIWE